jgi:hypothetical protein
MAERLVDVLNSNRTVLHTYPITVEGSGALEEAEYKAKALKAAAHAHLGPDEYIKGVTARMHVSRGGQLAPYGDDRNVLAGTKQGLEKVVAERAYVLWQQEGCPDGQADEHWHRAHDRHLRERA